MRLCVCGHPKSQHPEKVCDYAGHSCACTGYEDDFGYNTIHYPTLIAHHGNWDIYTNAKGFCAAIPTPEAKALGCKSSHFGDMTYLKHVPDLEYVK